MGVPAESCDQLVERRPINRLREHERGLQWDYRSIQCTGFARQFRRYDCRARADGRERKDGLRLGRGQRPRRSLRPGRLSDQPRYLRGSKREQASRRQVGRDPGGLAGTHPRAARAFDCRRGRGPDSDDDGDYEIASFSNRCGIAATGALRLPACGSGQRISGLTPTTAAPARGAPTTPMEHRSPHPW